VLCIVVFQVNDKSCLPLIHTIDEKRLGEREFCFLLNGPSVPILTAGGELEPKYSRRDTSICTGSSKKETIFASNFAQDRESYRTSSLRHQTTSLPFHLPTTFSQASSHQESSPPWTSSKVSTPSALPPASLKPPYQTISPKPRTSTTVTTNHTPPTSSRFTVPFSSRNLTSTATSSRPSTLSTRSRIMHYSHSHPTHPTCSPWVFSRQYCLYH